MELTRTVVVHRPRAEVFRRIADDFQETQPLICPLTVSVMLEGDASIREGVRGEIRVRNTSFTTRTVGFEVVRYAKDAHFAIAAGYGDRQGYDDYAFSDVAGGTRLQISSTADLRGPGWLRSWNERALNRHEEADTRRLKALIEGTGTPTARAARSPWRALVVYVLIAAVLAVIWATYRSLSS